MFARASTIQANRSSIDMGVAHVRDEVLTALKQLDGFIGLSMMVDRESGRCIATSAWRDEETMRASAAQVEPVRNRAAATLGGDATVEEWEIAMMHRDHPTHEGACVSSAWLRTDSGRIGDLVDTYKLGVLPQIEGVGGFCSASVMVNRASGRAVMSVCFESRAAMEAGRKQAEQMTSTGAQQAGATIVDVREFELALAHLRVPEMA